MSEQEKKAELAAVKKTKSGAAGWLTRACRRIEVICEKDLKECDFVQYEAAIAEFDKRLARWDEAQDKLEVLVPDEEVEVTVEQACDFRERCDLVKMKFVVDWNKANPETVPIPLPPGSDAASHHGSSVASEGDVIYKQVKLPKIELPKFDGDVLKFMPFWQQFEACVDSQPEFAKVSKFNYLIGALQGEAKSILEGLPITNENYEEAKALVKERFGRTELIIYSHIQSLLNISVPNGSGVGELLKLRDKLVANVRSLDALGIKSDKFGVILTPIIVSRLPEEIRMEWSRDSEKKEADLEYLMEFLKVETNRRERCRSFGTLQNDKGRQKKEYPKSQPGTASALVSTSKNCYFCGKAHPSHKCYAFLKLPVQERYTKVAEARLCFKCLSRDHYALKCKRLCDRCKGYHHSCLCKANKEDKDDQAGKRDRRPVAPKNLSKSVAETQTVSISTESADSSLFVQKSSVSIIPIATVQVKGIDKKWYTATLLFDSGADKSYVARSIVNRVRPKVVGKIQANFASFGGKSHKNESNLVELTVADQFNNSGEMCLKLLEVPVICSPLNRPKIDKHLLSRFQHLDLAHDYLNHEHVDIEILIGQDMFWTLMNGEIFRPDIGCGVVAQKSVFGWVLSGAEPKVGVPENDGINLLNIADIPDSVVKSFWDLDSIGVENQECDDPVLKTFEKGISFNAKSGRYSVGLTWKKNPPVLSDNYDMARLRLLKSEKRLAMEPELRSRYDDALDDMKTNNFIVEVDPTIEHDNPVFYLPHRPHVRETSTSTKIRPVFDASAAGPGGVSLNDCLESGPNLNPVVTDLLLRFRRWKYALSADIQKAFLQVELKDADQDVHRFLWRVGQEIKIMKFVRVTFGIKCSPFLLAATIRHHLALCPPSTVIEELTDNLYVDDFLSGADTEKGAHNLFVEAKRVMKGAGMNLTKWKCNEGTVIEDTTGVVGMSSSVITEYTKVLGVTWDPQRDILTYQGVEVPESVICTKRVVLSLIARVFDPLGLILPFTVTAKFLFQDIWRLGCEWDEELPQEMQVLFRKWLLGFGELKNISIQRSYFQAAWLDCLSNLELHAYGDASLKGYGACVYLKCVVNDRTQTKLVKACARVAPLTRKTLPRLELLGCLVTAQLLQYVIQALRLPSETKYICWTDSMVALGWIKGDPSRWKPWVANRVTTIQSLTDAIAWKHVVGDQNPADLVSRGISAENLMQNDLWWHGPESLRLNANSESDETEAIVFPYNHPEVQIECRTSKKADATLFCTENGVTYQFERWSSLNKAYKIIAWTLRFINLVRRKALVKPEKSLSVDEYANARCVFVKILQRQHFASEIAVLETKQLLPRDSKLCKLYPFLDENGILRVKGRIQLSELAYESKHPIILPCCNGTLLLIRFVHVHQNHAGVDSMITAMRTEYEVFSLRKMVKQVKKQCLACKKFDARSCNEPAAPLPGVRVTKAPAFSVTGIDFAGPIYCIDSGNKKWYICLFVCGVVRAVHLELVESLNKDDFVLAFRRFVALKCLPSVVYSDNGTNLVAGQKVLNGYLGPVAPKWKFICPRSPWWGGWWERLVRSVKNGIRKTVGKKCLTRMEMETCLCEVATSINSRPLTFVGTDVQNQAPLTPNHFLLGQGSQNLENNFVEDPENVNPKCLSLRHQEMLQRLDDFFKVWSTEYIRNLPPAFQKFRKQGNLEVGSVVLIREDNVRRMDWLMGVVETLHVGKDGVARSADLLTRYGRRTRAVQRLYNLEITEGQMPDCKNLLHEPDKSDVVPKSLPDDETVPVDSNIDNDVVENPKVDLGTDLVTRPKRSRRMPKRLEDFVCKFK